MIRDDYTREADLKEFQERYMSYASIASKYGYDLNMDVETGQCSLERHGRSLQDFDSFDDACEYLDNLMQE